MKMLRISKLICFVTGAALILVFRDFFVDSLRWFIGGLMVLYGLLGVAEVVLEKIRPIYNGNGFLFYCVEILLGLTTLIFVKEYSTVCIIWAVWSILRESVELKEIISGELHLALAIVSGIESAAVIVLSIMLITEPTAHHALIHTYLLCVELLLASSVPMLNRYVFKHHGADEKEAETDAPEPTDTVEPTDESEASVSAPQ